MLDEINVLNGVYADTSGSAKQQPDYKRYQDFPLLTTVQEIKDAAPKKDGEFFIFNTYLEVLDTYLLEKFGIDLYGFMVIYTENFAQNGFSIPVSTPYVTCVFRKEDDTRELETSLNNYQEMFIKNNKGNVSLNLHDYSVYFFTLIETASDILANTSKYPGHFYHALNHEMNLSMSNLFDMTVLYEEI